MILRRHICHFLFNVPRIGPVIAGMYMMGDVMKARKDFDVQYPNLYGEFE